MPHVSKKKNKRLFVKIYDKLIINLIQKGGPSVRSLCLHELLTDTEKIMLAKRFAAVSMLGEGFTFETIQSELDISPSTISRFWVGMQKGKYKNIIFAIRKRNSGKTFGESLLEIIAGPLRPINAPRWQWLDEYIEN